MTTSADLAHVRDVAAADRPAAARWAWLAARQRTWLSALLIVIFSALVLPPFVLLVQGSLTVGSTGVRFNPFRKMLVSANLLFGLTQAGLRDRVTPVISIDYAF